MTDSELVRLAFQEVDASPGFAGWLAETGLSLAVTAGNTLYLIGLKADGTLSVVARQFGHCAAVMADGPDTLFLATRYQIWRLENALPPGQLSDDGHDRLFLPQTAWTTGLVLVHGMGRDAAGRIVFVNGRFSCLATVSDRLNFDVVWVPPFVSALTPETRCLLTGVAVSGGGPLYATSASRSDSPDGWRACRGDGGVVMEVPSGEVVASNLTLPWSPVLAGERLWLTNGGAGEVGFVDPGESFQAVTRVPGFARGMAIHDHFAVVGSSKPRRGETFGGLPLEREASPKCGLFVVDLDSGRGQHWLLLEGGPLELQDVAILPATRSPTAVEFQGDDVQEWVTIGRVG
jgi:uncharacterized protein (TIGR03032 family)